MRGLQKIAAISALAVACASLLGCNGGGMREYYANQSLEAIFKKFDGEIERGTAQRPITLHVLENDTAKQSGYLKELLDGFNKMYADYHIVAIDANQDQYSDLATNGPYGYGPDVLYQANDMLMKYCEGKHITPLPTDKLDAYEHLPQLAKDTYNYSYAGSDFTMGVGVNVQAPMMYYRKDLLPENWEQEWDDDKNGTPDMVEDMRAMYRFSLERHAQNSEHYGFMQSLFDPYFSCGYLFSYGAYVFGENNTNTRDIGFAANDSDKGLSVVWQLASMMNEGCIDDSITVARESELASGNYFAVNNTQDMYGTMIDELVKVYRSQGMSASAAAAAAKENIMAVPIPKLPESGVLSETTGELVDSVVMGGVNGYAISSYTKYPVASLAFLNYATSYETMLRRNVMLGIAPVRNDVNADCTVQADIAHGLLDMLEDGRISIMPSISAVDQIWTPIQTVFTDVATDPYRRSGRKYVDGNGNISLELLNAALEQANKNIYNAIFTLA